tara:strand:- start:14348 stop:14869 length:522 start_codon:yes stop_codon:yes gene_type:complete
MLNFRFFQKINAEVIRRYRKHIFDPAGRGANAKDVYGREYKSYSNKGADVGWRSIGKGKNRKSVFIDSYANKKKTGKLKRQDEKFKDSKAPVLTGDLYKDFQLVKLGRSGFTFGNVARQSTVKFLKQMGRVIMAENKPLPDKVGRYIMREADRYVKKELSKITKGKKNIIINI